MKVDMRLLRRALGLAPNASEATVRASLADPPAPRTAPKRPAPARRPKLTAGAVAAMSPAQLQAAQTDALSPTERALVDAEADHRASMALSFPGEARRMGYAPVRRDLAARAPSVTKGLSE